MAPLFSRGDLGWGHDLFGASPVPQWQETLPALTSHLPTSSSQMKFSLEKLHQGITVSDPPFDSQPRPDDSFS